MGMDSIQKWRVMDETECFFPVAPNEMAERNGNFRIGASVARKALLICYGAIPVHVTRDGLFPMRFMILAVNRDRPTHKALIVVEAQSTSCFT